jgi:hypothetical protein
MTAIDEPEFLWEDEPIPADLLDPDGFPVLEIDIAAVERIGNGGSDDVAIGWTTGEDFAESFWFLDSLRDELETNRRWRSFYPLAARKLSSSGLIGR